MKAITQKQKELIEDMNEFCREKFDLSYERTCKEASEYIDRNIEQFKLLTMDSWMLDYM